ncbi:MAG TPA: tripartite tricarboxylate transporter substrate binding protein [Bordetella sp.]|nr:tripartite tricarboxylate transporter substrate binding protein [Bordetella sp.]
MNMNRWARAALACLAVGIAGSYQTPAAAQGYPNHPIRLVVGFAAGGNTDLMARLTAEQLTIRLGQPGVVENRAGAGGTVAGSVVAKAPADGYTLLFASTSHAIDAAIYKKLPYNTLKDFQPVAPVASTMKILVVNPSLPVHDVKEFIAYAKAHPTGLTMASPGLGSSGHLAGVLFNTMAGIEVTSVPYKGTGEALRDLVAGEVQSTVDSITAYIPMVKNGQLRALGVSSAQPTALLPGVPAITESGLPGYEVNDWVGVIAPAGVPADVVAKLNKAINEALDSPEVIKKLADTGSQPIHQTPEDYSKMIEHDIDRFEKLRLAAHMDKQ